MLPVQDPLPLHAAADRIPHPVPYKAAQGRTKARLILDPVRAPVITQIFTWRAVDKLGIPAIAARLNADPARYPAPNPAAVTGWTAGNVTAMLRNPKYTGYMVYGRHRTRIGRRVPVPQDQWLWSPAPVHPAIIDRETWDLAQTVSAGHGSSRDGENLNTHPATMRFYPYRSRVRCRDCDRRMAGSTYNVASQLTYYKCPHNWASPKHVADHPDHPRTVQAPELRLDEVVGRFFATRVFGPERAALLTAQLPATDAAAAADRDARVTAIQTRIGRIESAQNSQILELEELPANPADTATAALRARIRARFAELHEERERLEAQLKTLAKTLPVAADLTLLDRLPLAGDVLPDLPPWLKARLFQAFDIAVLWNKPGSQATVRAEITETTLQAVPGILDPSQDGYDDTGTGQPAPMGDLANTPRSVRLSQPSVQRSRHLRREGLVGPQRRAHPRTKVQALDLSALLEAAEQHRQHDEQHHQEHDPQQTAGRPGSRPAPAPARTPVVIRTPAEPVPVHARVYSQPPRNMRKPPNYLNPPG